MRWENKGMSPFQKKTPFKTPSYMAVMLNLPDSADGFPITTYSPFHFPLYDQTLALEVRISFLRHK